MFKQSILDEQDKVSSPRLQSFVCTIVGVLSIFIGFAMIAYGVKDVGSYVAIVLGATFGKGASDLWAAQLKSGKVLAAQATTTAISPPPTPESTAPVENATAKTAIAMDASSKTDGKGGA